ncbi:MAG TPA: phospho-sugar mutase [Acidimicrobiales bacterium]|nr:phospho-sugar mutase [Acidimicrobiales bacterium]
MTPGAAAAGAPEPDLVAAARAWRDEDPDPATRAELDRLLGEGTGDPPDLAALAERFGARLRFGTAGLRGEMGAGPNRMNRAVVIRATAGLAAHLVATGHAGGAVVVGHDARHRSDVFARDTAAVLAAAGFEVHLGDRPLPTPVVAFAVLHLGCCAGVQITASHNPAADNGYKLYLGDGAQIVPPVDAEVAAQIDAVGPLASVPRAGPGDPRITPVGDALAAAYVEGARRQVVEPAARDVSVVYTPLHGVGRQVVVEVLTAAGFPPPTVVPEQADPDPDFPTVAFPNPEEPGALDLALATASRHPTDVVLANDPDADRLAVAVPTGKATAGTPATGTGGDATPGAGQWRALTGDEVGVLLADWLIEHGHGPDRLVATTIVSSSMLSRLAAARGVAFVETLTGFKWLARAALDRPDLRFVYAYEEALGSCVGTLVRDKDGVTAALAFAELVAAERRRGRTVLDRLDDLSRELGVHLTRQRSVPVRGVDGLGRMRAVVGALAAAPPPTLAGVPVVEVEDLRRGGRLPPTDAVALRGDGVRLIVRPSGTEPKLKCYAEAVVPVEGGLDLGTARARAAASVERIIDDAVALVGPTAA